MAGVILRFDVSALGRSSQHESSRCGKRNWVCPQYLFVGPAGENGASWTAVDDPQTDLAFPPSASRKGRLGHATALRATVAAEGGEGGFQRPDGMIEVCRPRALRGFGMIIQASVGRVEQAVIAIEERISEKLFANHQAHHVGSVLPATFSTALRRI